MSNIENNIRAEGSNSDSKISTAEIIERLSALKEKIREVDRRKVIEVNRSISEREKLLLSLREQEDLIAKINDELQYFETLSETDKQGLGESGLAELEDLQNYRNELVNQSKVITDKINNIEVQSGVIDRLHENALHEDGNINYKNNFTQAMEGLQPKIEIFVSRLQKLKSLLQDRKNLERKKQESRSKASEVIDNNCKDFPELNRGVESALNNSESKKEFSEKLNALKDELGFFDFKKKKVLNTILEDKDVQSNLQKCEEYTIFVQNLTQENKDLLEQYQLFMQEVQESQEKFNLDESSLKWSCRQEILSKAGDSKDTSYILERLSENSLAFYS